jgi:hypothetical protein
MLDTGEVDLSQQELDDRRGTAYAARTALHCYWSIRTGRWVQHYLDKKGRYRVVSKPVRIADVPPNASGRRTPDFYVREQAIMMLLQEVDAGRFYSTGVQGDTLAKRLSSGEKRDGLPELVEFQRTWNISFPIPPEVGFPLEEVMVGRLTWPVVIIRQTRGSLILDLHLEAGREIALAFIRGKVGLYLEHIGQKRRKDNDNSITDHPDRKHGLYARRIISRKTGAIPATEVVRVGKLSSNRVRVRVQLQNGKLVANMRDILNEIRKRLPPNAKRSFFSFRNREHYGEVFRAIDLRRIGYSQSKVAKALWPRLKKDAQSVENLERSFHALAKVFCIPLK